MNANLENVLKYFSYWEISKHVFFNSEIKCRIYPPRDFTFHMHMYFAEWKKWNNPEGGTYDNKFERHIIIADNISKRKYFLCYDNVSFKFVVVRTPLWIISLFPFCKIHMHVKSEIPWGVYTTFISLLKKTCLEIFPLPWLGISVWFFVTML